MKLKLLKGHTHKGRKYPPNAEIEVHPNKVARLVAHGIAEKIRISYKKPIAQKPKETPIGEDNVTAND